LVSLLSLVSLITFKGLGSAKSSGEQPDNTKELKALETKIDENQKSIKKILDNNFEYSKNEVKESEKKKVEAEEKLKEKEKRVEELKVINKQQESEVTDFKDELAEKQQESKKYEESLTKKSLLIKEKEDEVKEIHEELKNLKSFESSIKSPKLMTLLNTLLENSALSAYRKESTIVDDSAKSIYNLLLKLSTGQIFVKSYYETLVEYKKENQKEMSREEVAFYEAINQFFGEDIIENSSKTKVDGKFDKSKHRGINNEKEGTFDSGIILIPSDTTNNDKIKVKLI